MKTEDRAWTVTAGGDIRGRNIHRGIKRRYRADTPFDTSIAPYLIMVLCGVVDFAFFYGLFSTISYDSPGLLAAEIAGFLFGFDVVPLFLGIMVKRLNQGVTRDKKMLWAALAVCILMVLLNATLRLAVMDQMDPNQTSGTIQMSGSVVKQETDPEVTPLAIAQTALGICMPLLTSIGSFFVSYLTYDPLKTLKKRREEELAVRRDDLRRYRAILRQYDEYEDHAAMLEAEDQTRYQSMLESDRALVFSHCEYVRQRLKEELADPASHSLLSQETCDRLNRRLDRELAVLFAGQMSQTPPADERKLPSCPTVSSSSVEEAA